MPGFLALDRIAAARGDGLHPKLRELLERRAVEIEGNPAVVEFGANRDGFIQAGPFPQTRPSPGFVPGNVVPLNPKAAAMQGASRKSSNR